MSTQPLEQAIAAARSVLENVSADQMSSATPCQSWDVSALINHMVGGHQFFAAGMKGEQPSGDETDFSAGDFVAAYDAACASSVEAFGAEGALQKMVQMPFGEMPGAAVMGLATTDTFTHAWDLAKATGQSTDLNPQLAAAILEQSKQMIQPAFRGEDGQAPFMAEQGCEGDACAADQLAAFLGRQV